MNKGVYGLNAPGGRRETAYVSLATATILNLYHPFPRSPDIVNVVFRCTQIDNGYAPGEELVVSCNTISTAGFGGNSTFCAVSAPGFIRTHDMSSAAIPLPLKTTGATFNPTLTRWLVKLKGLWFAPV